MLVGFKRATIGVFDDTGKVISTHVIEGKQNEGATTTANITGLAKEPTRVAGSDITYYVAQKGTGAVAADLGLLDLPNEVNDEILGYRKAESGISFIGNSTEPPYCALLLESEDTKAGTALFGLLKGRFSKDAVNLETLDPNTTWEPTAESYVFNAINDDKEGDSKGEVVAKYVGTEEAAITEIRNLVLPAADLPEG